jgi:RNA polymerase sigma factor (sigma-70 family)
MTPIPADISDGSLLRRFRGGVSDAATLLYFRYADHLHSLAAARLSPDLEPRLGAEDIVQSVFRTFFRRAALGQYEVPDGESLWKLFLVMALNKIRSAAIHHRAACRDVSRTPNADVAAPQAGDGGRADALSTLHLVIDELLQRLPPSSRVIIERRIEGYEVAEIAETAGCSKRSVERILREFRDQLHTILNED